MKLIDADNIKTILQNMIDGLNEFPDEPVKIEAALRTMIYIIDDQPTAYDVDKVVELLEKTKKMNADWGGIHLRYYEGKYNGLDESIEIVKSGGAVMSEIKLKPCPFCGGDAKKTVTNSEYTWISCKQCYAETCGSYNEKEAIEAWNRRAYE